MADKDEAISMAAKGGGAKEYKAHTIRVMEGLEAVRKRPAMYIGSTGPQGLHHLVYEVVDNSVDEALGGHCDAITVVLHKDGSCSVEDNGRGIPTDIHPTEKVSAAQVVLTKLHAGGKFDKDAYKFSGGLHGVGISVVNALSEWLKLTVWQDGNVYEQMYERGKPVAEMLVTGQTEKRGTLIQFMPDSKIFTETQTFSFETLSARLRELAFLNKKLRIQLKDQRANKQHEFYFEGGIVSFVKHISEKKHPLFDEILHLEQSDGIYELELALQYNDWYGEQLFSFVNNINTVEGGTHVSGFRSALTKVCNRKAQSLGILKSGESLSSEDVREGLVCVISLKVPEPQFEGQTKTKLGNSDVKGLVDSWTFAYLDSYFEENPSVARKILQKADLAKRAREAAKKARELTRRKTVFESAVLPGKLADCTNEDPSKTEVFIVEGDSAGGSAKQGRDRSNQAILPLRGKILNVEKARLDKILSNEEIKALIAAIGCGIGDEFDVTKARYHKIILMTDADVDGSHIRTLLLTFFFRYMQPLIQKGYLYIAKPPLYKAKIGRKEQYLLDESELKDFLFDWAREQTAFTLNGGALSAEEWVRMLDSVRLYDRTLEGASHTYKVGEEQCHKLVTSLYRDKWNPEQPVDDLLALLRHVFTQYDIELTTVCTMCEDTTEGDEPKHRRASGEEVMVSFKRHNVAWEIPLSFFSSSDMRDLSNALDPIAQLERDEWCISVQGKDRQICGVGILRLVNDIKAISKPYMSIQRYKGLGEMNPEQLWETAMDSKTRTLLKVSVEDALEADRWFATLMGDDVAGRRDYIERFGQFAKNLDV